MFEQSVSFIPSIWASMNSWFTPTVLFLFLNLMIGTIFITTSLANSHKGNDQHKQQDHPQPHQFARSPSVLQRLKSINFYTYRSPEPNTSFTQTPGMDSHFTYHNLTHEPEQHQHQPPQSTTGSPLLQRLKSINLYNYLSQESSPSPKTQEEDTHQQENVHHQEPQEEGGNEGDEYIENEEESPDLDEVYGQPKGSHVSRTKSDTKPVGGEIPKKLPKKMKKSASTKSAFSHFEEEDIVETRRPATTKEGKAKATQVVDDEVDAKADDFIYKFKQQLKLQRIDSIIRYKEMITRGSEN
ncbi:pathogen-associated molecular patterns-induced protein A70-like [Pistacia vera]|uniref:pathogen-associated molecular patterns-induced protein A70-like n=1 Tax=Pistacia vera TaxID=55513 RepID=UPI001263B844|nr:pathogen-associated molecular patterns-induced protein A70-like [Pistacia vera]